MLSFLKDINETKHYQRFYSEISIKSLLRNLQTFISYGLDNESRKCNAPYMIDFAQEDNFDLRNPIDKKLMVWY